MQYYVCIENSSLAVNSDSHVLGKTPKISWWFLVISSLIKYSKVFHLIQLLYQLFTMCCTFKLWSIHPLFRHYVGIVYHSAFTHLTIYLLIIFNPIHTGTCTFAHTSEYIRVQQWAHIGSVRSSVLLRGTSVKTCWLLESNKQPSNHKLSS